MNPKPERVRSFGDTPEVQTALAVIVVSGQKRATTSLARWYEPGGEPLPAVDETWTVVDGAGRSCCRCRTIGVEIRRFCEVDAAFAAVEGEGDGSLDYWQTTHRAYFIREGEASGFAFEETAPVVLERFELIEPSTAVRHSG